MKERRIINFSIQVDLLPGGFTLGVSDAELIGVSQGPLEGGMQAVPEGLYARCLEKAAQHLREEIPPPKPTLEQRVAALERLHGMEAR